jgi:hypothetical protein
LERPEIKVDAVASGSETVLLLAAESGQLKIMQLGWFWNARESISTRLSLSSVTTGSDDQVWPCIVCGMSRNVVSLSQSTTNWKTMLGPAKE